jgi:hypothetical protein
MGLLFSLNLIHKVYINNADIELLCTIELRILKTKKCLTKMI